jgi:hypothetical protein
VAAHGDDSGTFTLVLEPAGWDRDVKLRIPPEHTAELRQLLEDAGLPVSAGAEFSHGPVLDLLIATVQTPEMWAALGGSVTAFLARNQFRRVRISRDETTLIGYGAEDAERLISAIDKLREQVEHNEQEAERIKRDLPRHRQDYSGNGT